MADGSLEAFIENVSGDSHLRVEADLGDGFVRLRSAEAERRQAAHDIRSTEDIVIEMLRNARDAHAKSVFAAVSREGGRRRIVMVDDGDGVPPASPPSSIPCTWTSGACTAAAWPCTPSP